MSSSRFYVHESSIVESGATIGEETKVWHFCHIFEKAVIGKKCVIGQNVMIANKVILGDNVKVQNNVSIYEGVICESDVFLGPSMVFTNVINPRSAVNRKNEYKTTLVERGATIGANATIVCGITVGKYALIGAGSVVTKPVRSYALVVGNPAKQIGWVSRSGQRLEFDNRGRAVCSETKELYQLENGFVKKL